MSPAQQKKIGLAIASLVCGLFFWFPLLGIILSIVALILGIVALVNVNKNQEIYGGKGMAISGIVLGGIGIILIPIIAILAAIAVPQFYKVAQRARENAAIANMKTIVTACEVYNAQHGTYPANAQDIASDLSSSGTSVFSANGKDGYYFMYTSNGKTGFNVSAKPTINSSTSQRYFVANESGKIYIDGDKDGVAGTEGDTLLEQ